MGDLASWVDGITNPFALFGLVVLAVAGIAKLVLSADNRLSGRAQERLANRIILAGSILAVIAIVAGVLVGSPDTPATDASEAGHRIQTRGDQSPALDSGGGDVSISYGDDDEADRPE